MHDHGGELVGEVLDRMERSRHPALLLNGKKESFVRILFADLARPRGLKQQTPHLLSCPAAGLPVAVQ